MSLSNGRNNALAAFVAASYPDNNGQGAVESLSKRLRLEFSACGKFPQAHEIVRAGGDAKASLPQPVNAGNGVR